MRCATRLVPVLACLVLMLSACHRPTVISPPESKIDQGEKQKAPSRGRIKIVVPNTPPPASSMRWTDDTAVATLAVFAPKDQTEPPPPPPRSLPESLADIAREAMKSGLPVEMEAEWEDGGSQQREARAEGRGPGLTTTDPQAAKDFKTETPAFGLFGKGGGSSSLGGAGAASFRLVGAQGLNAFTLLGGIGLLVGIAGIIFAPGMRRIFIGVSALGAASIGVGLSIQHAPWLWVLLVIGGLAFGAWWVWNERRDGRTKKALEVVAEGLEKAPPEAAAAVKGVIGRRMKETKQFDALDRAVNEAKAEAVRRAK